MTVQIHHQSTSITTATIRTSSRLYMGTISASFSSSFRSILRQQQRNATTGGSSSSSKASSSCPFTILGIQASTNSTSSSSSISTISYSQVKAAFIKLALKHHPDRGGTADEFRRIRHAFESIRELPDGTCTVVDTQQERGRQDHDDDYYNPNDDWWNGNKKKNSNNTNHSLEDWFFHETGTRLSFYMDSATRKEVAAVVATMSQGGLDKGGMWDMARMIARDEAENPSRDDPIPLEAGTTALGKRRRKR